MNAIGQDFAAVEARRRRSRNVALVFLGTVGVAGGLVAWDAWQRARGPAADSAAPVPPAPPVSADRDYANNAYVPGAGYYHAAQHAWFPFPYNYHDPARGYYGGGLWHLAPLLMSVLHSRPAPAAAASAFASQRAYEAEQPRRAPATSSFSSRSSGFSSFRSSGFTGSSADSSAGKSAAPSAGGSSVSRGGFGGSAHGAGSSS